MIKNNHSFGGAQKILVNLIIDIEKIPKFHQRESLIKKKKSKCAFHFCFDSQINKQNKHSEQTEQK